jgi:hypothetical protein
MKMVIIFFLQIWPVALNELLKAGGILLGVWLLGGLISGHVRCLSDFLFILGVFGYVNNFNFYI